MKNKTYLAIAPALLTVLLTSCGGSSSTTETPIESNEAGAMPPAVENVVESVDETNNSTPVAGSADSPPWCSSPPIAGTQNSTWTGTMTSRFCQYDIVLRMGVLEKQPDSDVNLLCRTTGTMQIATSVLPNDVDGNQTCEENPDEYDVAIDFVTTSNLTIDVTSSFNFVQSSDFTDPLPMQILPIDATLLENPTIVANQTVFPYGLLLIAIGTDGTITPFGSNSFEGKLVKVTP